jgi:hypothetical protein
MSRKPTTSVMSVSPKLRGSSTDAVVCASSKKAMPANHHLEWLCEYTFALRNFRAIRGLSPDYGSFSLESDYSVCLIAGMGPPRVDGW